MLKELDLAKDLKRGRGKLDVTFHLKYQCPICEEVYDTATEATACFWTTEEPEFRPGEVVIIPTFLFGWYDGDPLWVVGEAPVKDTTGLGIFGAHLGNGRGLFFWVVEAVHGIRGRSHELAYTVSTGALAGGRRGWTSKHHLVPQKVNQSIVPPFVLKDAARRARNAKPSMNLLG